MSKQSQEITERENNLNHFSMVDCKFNPNFWTNLSA